MAAAHDLLLLDLDGTISDPLVGIGRSINHALCHFGFAPLEMSQVPAYIGPPLDESFRALTGITDAEQIGACITRSAAMVGDRAVDITAARRNGLSAAGVMWGHGPREELEREQPRYLLSAPAQLPTLVGNEMEV